MYRIIRGNICFNNNIEKYKHINILILTHSIISDVSGIEELTNLTYLNLSYNSRLKLPKNISKLEKLKYLTLTFSNFIDCELLEFKNLEYLDLSHNPIKLLNLPYEKLNNLNYLNLAATKISDLPGNFNQLSKLKILNICGIKNLIKLPKVLLDCSNINKLILNRINNLKPLGEMNLNSLIINNDCLYYKELCILPDNIGNIHNLFLDCNNKYYVEFKNCDFRYHKDIINKGLKIEHDKLENIKKWKPSIFNINRLGVDNKFIEYLLTVIYYSNIYLIFDVQSIIVEYLIIIYFKDINNFFTTY